MASPVGPGKLRRVDHGVPSSDSLKARLFLFAACLWPLVILALFASSAPQIDKTTTLRASFRDMLDRVDVMGYGPTHPRVAFVVVGDKKTEIIDTVKSIFGKTDMNRVFTVVAVLEAHSEDSLFVKELDAIAGGTLPHWHGDVPDQHEEGDIGDDEHPHGQKIHVLFNEKAQGVAAARADAVEFIQILEEEYENAGLKSHAEDLILVLLQAGTEFASSRWLGPVTEGLIVPPPILEEDESMVSLKLANAISFNVEGTAKRTSFDSTLAPVITEVSTEELNDSNGQSYLAPALNEAACAMRLNTYTNLPFIDTSLADSWAATLDLSLNLWLCADGIDVLTDVQANVTDAAPEAPLSPSVAARFAAAWMDDVMAKKFFHAYTATYQELTFLEWEAFIAKAKISPDFTSDLTTKCRSFQWYATEINKDLAGLLKQSDVIEKEEETKPEPKAQEEEKKEGVAIEEPKKEEEKVENAVPLPDKPLDPPKVDEVDENAIPERKEVSSILRRTNIEIVSKAKPVDLAFVDVSDGHREHPHLGAKDEQGNFGYVHDETALHNNPPAFAFGGDDLSKACLKHDNNYKMLTEKVYVDLKGHEEAEKSGKKRDKIFCLVYTTEKGHSSIPRIRETWGQKCDGFMVGSTKTDKALGTVEIPHEGPEEYNNIWQKVRSMWSYVYDNYYDKYDWFHIGGDDLYVIVENLRLYLESDEIKTAANGGMHLPMGNETSQTPLFMGRRFAYMGHLDDIFISGGSGYTMNKAALKILATQIMTQDFPHAHTFSEDTMIARAFKKHGVEPYDTKDDAGGERYMPFMPGHHYGYRMPVDKSKDWYAKYSIDIKEGPDHCAAKSVAFHYVKEVAMYRLHALLYHLCPAGTV